MIDKSELRIGNYVLYDDKPTSYLDIVTQIFEDGVEIISNSAFGGTASRTFEQIEPVKIQYNVLIQCGFIDHAQNGWGCRIDVNSSDELCLYTDDNELKYQSKNSGFTRGFNIKYLHQLQNLYFILTGKELQLKYN